MSNALACDNCNTVLPLNARGESDTGEDSAWLVVTTRGFGTSWDACTRSCAIELINGDIGQVVDAELEAISSVVRAIDEGREETTDE